MINIDHQTIKIQSGALGLIIKQLGKNIFTGKSIINMSLPIELFGKDSNL